MTDPTTVQPTIMDDIKGFGPTLSRFSDGVKDAFNYASEHFPTATKWGIFIGTALVGGRLAHWAVSSIGSHIPGIGPIMSGPFGALMCYMGAAFAGNYLGNSAVGAYGPDEAPKLNAPSDSAPPVEASEQKPDEPPVPPPARPPSPPGGPGG